MKNAEYHTVADIMQESGVAFGTSGARGLVSALTDKVAWSYTVGFLKYLYETGEFTPGMEVALAGDLRPSTPRILHACIQAIIHMDGRPVYCGKVPTPALALYAFEHKIPSLMVTGSHIPDDRNGIKFQRPEGELLKSDELGVARQLIDCASDLFDIAGNLRKLEPLPRVRSIESAYKQRYLDFFGSGALTGLRVGVYQHSAVGRDCLVKIIQSLGAEAIPLGRSDDFIPVDTEALRSEDIDLARQWSREHQIDAIVSTDGDSDRPLLSDREGNWLRGDILGMLCAREIGADTVVTPVSSNTAVERSGFFRHVVRTRIGSPYVIEAMEEAASSIDGGIVCGYEANGGFLLQSDIARNGRSLSRLPTRDAILPIIAVLSAARIQSIAEICQTLPQRVTWSDRIQDFPTSDSSRILSWLSPASEDERRNRIEQTFPDVGALREVDETDGLRMTFAGGAIIHLRPSGNAPELRCYTEADTLDEARRLNETALKIIRNDLLKAAVQTCAGEA